MTPIEVEVRGITFRQLCAVHANASRRCIKVKWLSTKDFKTPLTSHARNGHSGEPFDRSMACLRQMIQDFQGNGGHFGKNDNDDREGGMTEDTPIWICAFANNQ